MDYKETHISFLYDDLVKEYGNEQGKQLYANLSEFPTSSKRRKS